MSMRLVPGKRGCRHNLSAVETPKLVGEVVKGVDGNAHRLESGRTGRILYLPDGLPSRKSSWIEEVHKNRARAAS
jgi:hypothetical protein